MKPYLALPTLRCALALLIAFACFPAGGWAAPKETRTLAPNPAAHGTVEIEVVDQPNPKIGMLSMDSILSKSMYLYSDSSFRALLEFPAELDGAYFYELTIKLPHTYRCTKGGELNVLAAVGAKHDASEAMSQLGFVRTAGKPFQLYEQTPAALVALFTKTLKPGEKFALPAGAIALGFSVPRPLPSGELLYNGIRLPREWPPRIDWSTDEAPVVPYLEHRPALVPIDIGRQLFIDDFLIEATDLVREFHYPEKYSGNPVLTPETEIERTGLNNLAVAGPKSGGLWWNPEKQLFELWYEAGWVSTVAYATSRDGLHWDRPSLPLRPGTNQVLRSEIKPDSWTVVRDYRAVDSQQAFKIFLRGGGSRDRARYFVSADGLDWGAMSDGGITGDRSTMFYNPFREKWVFSLRWSSPGGRSRAYVEADDFQAGMNWLPDQPVPWARADRLDPPDPRVGKGNRTSLYNLDAVAYESVLLGFFEILYGPANDVGAKKGIPKFTGLNFAYSRDGFHWHRPDRSIAINSEHHESWERGYVQSLGNLCVVRGDKLWFYYIGFAGDPKVRLGDPGVGDSSMRSGLYANGATGVAFLRRDGFVSMNAGDKGGSITTRPVSFSGRHLFVNVAAAGGALLAEAVDMRGQPIAPFTFENCEPVTADATLAQVHWRGGDDLTPLANRAVRFRFRVTNAQLYAFWVSRDATGRSDGYVAGGGPGFTSDLDTVGAAALDAERQLSQRASTKL